MKKLENEIRLGEKLDIPKCLLCGIRETMPEKGLCGWCGSSRTRETIVELWTEISTELSARDTISIKKEPIFDFLQSIGALGTMHPYLKRIRDVIRNVISERVHGKNFIDYSVLNLGRLRSAVYLMHSLKLIKENRDEMAYEVPPESIIELIVRTVKVKDIMHEYEEIELLANVVFGYVLIGAIKKTVEENGFLRYGEGITALCVTTRDGRLLIPKKFTAPALFVLGKWSSPSEGGFNEDELLGFLNIRGINYKGFKEIRDGLAGRYPSAPSDIVISKIISIDGVGIDNFKFTPKYEPLRENIRERIRERGDRMR